MSLNLSKGNMYGWTTHTVNPIRGQCPSMCQYCYVKKSRVKNLYQGPPHLVESFFKKGLGKGKTIFIGSCFDLFADGLYPNWVNIILQHCWKYPDNTYLFQSKNTRNMYGYKAYFPPKVIIGTTAETNRTGYNVSKAPWPQERLAWLSQFVGIDRFVSIEPIMDFNLGVFVTCIKQVKPKFVSIGADSKKNNLPEPPAGKVGELIQELEKFTEVRIKPNLNRIMD